jgi:hypothetical protein
MTTINPRNFKTSTGALMHPERPTVAVLAGWPTIRECIEIAFSKKRMRFKQRRAENGDQFRRRILAGVVRGPKGGW